MPVVVFGNQLHEFPGRLVAWNPSELEIDRLKATGSVVIMKGTVSVLVTTGKRLLSSSNVSEWERSMGKILVSMKVSRRVVVGGRVQADIEVMGDSQGST